MNMLQSLIRRKPVRTRHISILEACGNYLSQPPPPPPPLPQDVPAAPSEGGFKRYENPCLDLFYNVLPHKPASHVHLKRLMPPAWSHNPLTTLKIIRYLHDVSKYQMELDDDIENDFVFLEAVYWLHHNHPKTLAYNLPYLGEFGWAHHTIFLQTLYRVLELKQFAHKYSWYCKQQHVERINKTMERIIDEMKLSAGQKKLMPEIDKIREMYEGDSDFRFLHDRVADLFAESIKFDIENLLKVQRKQLNNEEVDEILEVTCAAQDCDGAPLLLESIAKRIFPERHEYKDDDNYRYRVVQRFRNEVLDPLIKVMDKETYGDDDYGNPSGYIYVSGPPGKYWKSSDRITPHELVHYVIEKDGDVDQVVELQWKTMVGDLKKKHKDEMGILSHSLVAIGSACRYHDMGIQMAMALTILISELSQVEAWKGKMIHLIPNPGLLLIQGHDLKSKCEFLSNLTIKDGHTDFKRMFDSILEEAVSWSLKPEQMVKRVFVFTDHSSSCFERISGGTWETRDYEEMQSKYKEQGYNMPHIVFWKLGNHLEHVQQFPDHRGVAIMSGFRKYQMRPAGANLVSMFLENDGDLTPQHVMEANLCSQDGHYSRLAVVD